MRTEFTFQVAIRMTSKGGRGTGKGPYHEALTSESYDRRRPMARSKTFSHALSKALFANAVLAAAVPLGSLLLGSGAALAQQEGYGQTLGTSPQERQMYDYGPSKSGGSGSSVFDSTNPLDLLNKLRKSTALDNATPPDSAIDQALKDFDAQQAGKAAPKRTPSGSSSRLQGI
jgi:hypothetical protein